MSSFDEKAVLDILEKVSKCVVNISTVKLVHHMFYQAVPIQGMGSGAIIDPRGHILTNNHVVGGARKKNLPMGRGQIRLDTSDARLYSRLSRPHEILI